jgi:hypothetical protein
MSTKTINHSMKKFALSIAGSLLIIAAPTSFSALAQSDIQGGKTCRVSDPTGTLLNVRSSPNGQIVGKIKNGKNVYIQSVERDAKGKPWVLIAVKERGKLRELGFVLREFIGCFE